MRVAGPSIVKAVPRTPGTTVGDVATYTVTTTLFPDT